MKPAWLVIAGLCLVGCAHQKIPGTDIDKTDDTSAIVSIMEKYRSALVAKDVPAIVSLLAPDFHDNGGTADPEDDLTPANVQTVLSERLSRVADLAVEMDLRDIKVDKANATATYYYTVHYKMPSLTSRAQSESDLKQMTLEKVKGVWRIASGI